MSMVSFAAHARPCDFPSVPPPDVTAGQDRAQMECQLGVTEPVLPSKLADPNAPPNTHPKDASNPEGNWTDDYGHIITRSPWGLWNNYEDALDGFLPGGSDGKTLGSPDSWRVFDAPVGSAAAPHSKGQYTPLPLLRMHDGKPVRNANDWWNRRRPQILNDVQTQLYGFTPERSRWPAITWSVSAITTGVQTGSDGKEYAYREKTLTGTVSTAAYPQIRNAPVIRCVLRTPVSTAGTAVPVLIVLGSNAAFQFTAPAGIGTCGYDPKSVQADNGAGLTSYVIGLINKGHWRKPSDWGALAAWAWGASRIVDYFEQTHDPDVDATKLGIEGHSRFGKAALLATALDRRIAFSYPSSAGSGGTSMERRHWGEELENVASTSEYHWMCGNLFKLVGPLHGAAPGSVAKGTYLPRKIEKLSVDAHSLFALAAPRPIFTNSGTGDSWEDPYGQFLSAWYANPVYELLGAKGLVAPAPSAPNLIETDTDYIDGDIGFRYHDGGHVDRLDFPAFVQFAARHLNSGTPR